MKDNIINEIRSLFANSSEWVRLEVEYAKLTVAEKFSILAGALVLGGVVMLLVLPLFIILLFAVVNLFKLVMSPVLAYLSTAGCVVLLIGIIFLLRDTLIFNPIARFITKLFFENKRK